MIHAFSDKHEVKSNPPHLGFQPGPLSLFSTIDVVTFIYIHNNYFNSKDISFLFFMVYYALLWFTDLFTPSE